MNELPLRDIHLPGPVSWWPPAPGWWILLILVIALAVFIPWLIRWIKEKPLNTLAKREFKTIIENFQDHQDETILIRDISIFLRRVIMSYEGREHSAGLTGSAWLQKLNALTPVHYFKEDVGQILLNAPYRESGQFDHEQLIETCRNWLSSLPRRKP